MRNDIDWQEEMKRMEKESERLEKWTPTEGKHIMVLKSNGREHEIEAPNNKIRTRVRFEIQLEGEDIIRNWWVNKSAHEKSTFMQIGKAALNNDGDLKNVKIAVNVVGDGKERYYHIEEIGKISPEEIDEPIEPIQDDFDERYE